MNALTSTPRPRRWWRRKRVIAAVLLVAIVPWVPWPLDTTRRDGVEAAAFAIAREEGRRIATRPSEASALFAGWHTAAFVLPEGIPLAGYGARKGASSVPGGERLDARALSLRSETGEEVVIIMADLLFFNRPMAEEIRRRLTQSRAPRRVPRLLFTATHTHSGPGGWSTSWVEQVAAMGPYHPEVFEGVAATVVKAVEGALEKQGPAQLANWHGSAPELIRNRTIGGGPVDPALDLLAVRRTDTGEIALVVSFGAHATVFGPGSMVAGRDYPGVLVETLEALPEVAFAGFAAGAAGSQSGAGGPAGATAQERAKALGEGVAAPIAAALPQLVYRNRLRLQSGSFTVKAPPLQIRISAGWRLSPWTGMLLHDRSLPFDWVRLDDLLWVTLPVEYSGMLSAPLRRKAQALGLTLVLTCFNGEYLGYVLPDRHYKQFGLYEARMNFLGPYGGSFITTLIETLID